MDDLHFGFIPLVLLGCTRAIYIANEQEGSVFTVRSMDWSDPNIATSLWVSPRGSKRTGAGESDEGHPYTWESKYKSLALCNYGKSTTDGINEEGLVANLLFLPQASYEHNIEETSKKRLPITALAQYVLDNFATVKEAVEELEKEPFFIVTSQLPVARLDRESKQFEIDLKDIVLYLTISDAKGDSAVLQYVKDKNGLPKLAVSYFPEEKETITVSTNGLYKEQLNLLKQFQNEDGDFDWGEKNETFQWDELKKNVRKDGKVIPDEFVKEMNPAMNGLNIRFLRASFYSNRLDKIDDKEENQRPFIDETERKPGDKKSNTIWLDKWSDHEGLARAFSLIRNLSTPLNVQAIDDNPFLASTVWRTVADHGNKLPVADPDHRKKRYFFESSRALYPLYVDVEELFDNLETVKKLDLYVPPAKPGDQGIDLLEDQLNEQEKIGKVNHLFQDVEGNQWFYFDYQRKPSDP